MKIQVTWEDIRGGRAHNPCHCPVAKAVQRAFGTQDASCGINSVSTLIQGVCRTYRLPSFVSLKISTYDATGEMEPFEFELTEAKQ